MIPINYHHLYYFYVIAREGSIARACEKLFLAQPTLSTQLKLFEKTLKKRLFDREGKRLRLTDDGRMVLDYAESIFELGSELHDALQDRPSQDQLAIQIGVLNGTPRSFAHALVESVLTHAPTAQVHLQEGRLETLLNGLRDHRVDVVLTDVAARGHERDELENHLIGQVPVIFAASPALARKHRRVPDDLPAAPMILPSSPSQIYHQVLDQLAAWKVQPRIVAEVQDIELARRLALSGRGIAPLNAFTVSVSLPKKGLVALKGSESVLIKESVYLVTRRRKMIHPIVKHLLENFRLN